MLLLYLRRCAPADGVRHPLFWSAGRRTAALMGFLYVLAAIPVWAQEKPADKAAAPQNPAAAPAAQPAPAAPVINFRERPHYTTDPQRMRRTVQIDGVISDGEWDPFYTVTDGPVNGTVYCNWDDNYLYLAARTEQPATLLFDVDANGDGWLRGADNLEVVIGSIGETSGLTVVTRLLDAANSKESPSWNDKAVDPKTLLIAAKNVNGTQTVELAIPKNTASLVLRPGATLGLRVEFLPPGPAAVYTPTQPFEPHLMLDATLANASIQAMAGVNPRLTLSDYKCVPGQTLFATLELLNQTDRSIPILSVSWTGQGNSANAINSLREVTVPPLPALKTLKLKYRTPLPPNLAIGSYTLSVTVEMPGGKQVQSAASFAVVEPLQAQMSSEPEPVAIVGQTKLTVSVDVFSAVPNHLQGNVELTKFPPGWELQGNKKRGLYIDREDARRAVHFDFKLPSTTPAGDYPFEAIVTWHKQTWTVQHVVHVIRTDAPTAPK